MVKYISLLAMMLLLFCCTVFEKNQLTYYGKYAQSNKSTLKLNGYYAYEEKKANYNDRDYFVLYENGTLFRVPTNIVKSLKKEDNFADDKTLWGTYYINNDTIYTQYFTLTNTSLLAGKYSVINIKGLILNDSTIQMYESFIGGKKYTFKHSYFFKMSAKPDSTNWMMTDKKMKKILKRNRK